MAKTMDYNPKALELLGKTPQDLEPQDKKQVQIDENTTDIETLAIAMDILLNGEST